MSTTLLGMGLLDDAIREHLDLKRRHGADPTEVERSEREALGPVRRTPERVPGGDSDREPEADGEVGAAPGAISDDGLVGSDALDEAASSPLPGSEPDEDEPSWSYDEPSAAHEPHAGPQVGIAPPPHRADSERLDADADHTAEYDVAATLGSEHLEEPPRFDVEAAGAGKRGAHAGSHEHGAPPGEDEDVLEETPEFLQDTPDHDRLWFEQRPPKDFDFDG